MSTQEQRVALFIDADNAPASHIDVILAELAQHGTVCIRRAYGNWKGERLASWEKLLHEYAIQPVQQFDLTKGKNATDIALVIDAMDALFARNIDVFAIVSSDCDFTPLATRLQADGKRVIGFGERKTPVPLVNACSTFLYLENDVEPPDPEPGPARDPARLAAVPVNLKGDARLINLLRGAVHSAESEDGWAHLGKIGQLIANQASFDSRNYGFKKLADLYRAIDLFEVQERGGHLAVRDRRAGRSRGATAEGGAS